MDITDVVTHKPYYAITFQDIAEWWVLGAKCGCCGHSGPINRRALERRSGGGNVGAAAKFIRCTKCGNRFHNIVNIAGKQPR